MYENELIKIKGDLELFLPEKVEKLTFFSRVTYYAEGERNTKYFFGLAKSRYTNKVMYGVKNTNGDIVSEPNAVLKIQADFYDKLYKSNPKANFELVNNGTNQLTDSEHEELDTPLTINELKKVVMHFSDGKTPGVDGITVGFYQKFWPEIGECLFQAYNDAFNDGQLFISARRGIMSLTPKKD